VVEAIGPANSALFPSTNTGIPQFTLLMWGFIKNLGKRKPRKLRLLSSTKGEENRIEL
jgi:hypothetical protein